MDERTPHQRCVIDRFRINPDEFLIDGRYMCDVPCKPPQTTGRLTQICGRIVIPYINGSGNKDICVDTSSSRCAITAGTVVSMDTIDTSQTWYLGEGKEAE